MEYNGHRQYTIKIDGSSRTSIRNRRHLSKVFDSTPAIPEYKAGNSDIPDESHLPSTPPSPATPLHHTTSSAGENIPSSPTVQQQQSTSSTPSTSHYVRRSHRHMKQPDWFHKEFNS